MKKGPVYPAKSYMHNGVTSKTTGISALNENITEAKDEVNKNALDIKVCVSVPVSRL